MTLAKKHFGIPTVLDPEYLSSPYIDELSGMSHGQSEDYNTIYLFICLLNIFGLSTKTAAILSPVSQ